MTTVMPRLTRILLATMLAQLSVWAKELSELKLLYVGPERTADFVEFLKPQVARIETRSRAEFKAGDLATFAVILLEWPQTGNDGDFPPKASQIGAREA